MVSVKMFIFSVCQGHTSYTPLLLLRTGGARLYRPEKVAQIVVAEKVTARSVMQCGTTCFETSPLPVYSILAAWCAMQWPGWSASVLVPQRKQPAPLVQWLSKAAHGFVVVVVVSATCPHTLGTFAALQVLLLRAGMVELLTKVLQIKKKVQTSVLFVEVL